MKVYFKGHKDSTAINEYLNNLSEDSIDFKVVYQLRKMGEKFNDGILSMNEVNVFDHLVVNGISDDTDAFIKQMKCYTFYSAICHIGQGTLLTPFEMLLKHEIEHPSWKGEANTFNQKLSRWWHARWKHPLVYNEWWLPAMATCMWSVVRRNQIVKD